MLWFNTLEDVKAETLTETLLQVRTERLKDALGYPQEDLSPRHRWTHWSKLKQKQ